MIVEQIAEVVTDFFGRYLQRPGRIVAIIPAEAGWTVEVEVVEEDDYMRRRGRDEIMGLYEVMVAADLEIAGYRRKALRMRNLLTSESQEEENT